MAHAFAALACTQNLKALLGSANWPSIMLIKTITLHSFTFLVGITSSMAVHQVIPSDATARFRSGTETAAIFAQQVANRSIKK